MPNGAVQPKDFQGSSSTYYYGIYPEIGFLLGWIPKPGLDDIFTIRASVGLGVVYNSYNSASSLYIPGKLEIGYSF